MKVGGRISRHYVPLQAIRDVSPLDSRRSVKVFWHERMKEFHILGLRSGDLGGCNSGSTVRSVTW